MGLLLPDKGLPEAPSAEPDSSFIEHSFADSMVPIEFNLLGPFDPPPVRQEPPSTDVVFEETASFVIEEQPAIVEELAETVAGEPPLPPSLSDLPSPADELPIYQPRYPVPQKHSFTGIITTIGAVFLLMAFLLFNGYHQITVTRLTSKLAQDPANESIKTALRRLSSVPAIAKWPGISGTVICMVLASLSLLPRTKKLWSIIGFIANGVVLVWILIR